LGVLDTGSFELLVFSSDCLECGNSSRLYDHSASSTYLPGSLQAKHSFGSGDAYSLEAFDEIAIGPLSARHQNFWEVARAEMPVLKTASFQSIIGVGPPNAPVDEAWSTVQAANHTKMWYVQKNLPVPLDVEHALERSLGVARRTAAKKTLLETLEVHRFSVCLGRQPGSEGYFVWNDGDPAQRPEVFTPLQVLGTATWGVKMQNARLGTSVALGCEEGCGAILDSGTSLLSVPSAVVTGIKLAMEMILHANCSNLHEMPPLQFTIGDAHFSLPPDAYVGHLDGEVPEEAQAFFPASGQRSEPAKGAAHQCQLLLMETSDAETQLGPLWILGMPFFRQYYTTFDLGQDKSQRRHFTAPAVGDECSLPGAAPSLVSTKPPLRRLAASGLRVPAWLAGAKARSYLAI
jgi:hypothetical protein